MHFPGNNSLFAPLIEYHCRGLYTRHGLERIFMKRYAILRAPHANSRYDASLDQLTRAELGVIAQKIHLEIDPQPLRLGRMDFLTFEGQLSDEQLNALGRLSGLLGIFEQEGELLRPLSLPESLLLARDMPSVLKYKGKTNEMFTRMLINLAAFSSKGDPFAQLSLLDPMAGRGTTLFCALGYGYDSFGIELDKKEVSEGVRFCKTYFEHQRMKHAYSRTSMTLPKGSTERHTFATAVDAQSYKAGSTMELSLCCANSLLAPKLCGKKKFDLLVCDLPYGIQHGNDSGKTGKGTLSLLERALPVWASLLQEGAALAMSFNSYTISRKSLQEACRNAGLAPLTGGPYDQLEHWVEQAVMRDVVVARKEQP